MALGLLPSLVNNPQFHSSPNDNRSKWKEQDHLYAKVFVNNVWDINGICATRMLETFIIETVYDVTVPQHEMWRIWWDVDDYHRKIDSFRPSRRRQYL